MENRRKEKRVEFKKAVQLNRLRHTQPFRDEQSDGSLGFDLSRTGIRLISEQFIPLNEKVVLNFYLDHEKMITLEGKVVWIQKVPHNELYHIGLEFTDVTGNKEYTTALYQFFEKLN